MSELEREICLNGAFQTALATLMQNIFGLSVPLNLVHFSTTISSI